MVRPNWSGHYRGLLQYCNVSGSIICIKASIRIEGRRISVLSGDLSVAFVKCLDRPKDDLTLLRDLEYRLVHD